MGFDIEIEGSSLDDNTPKCSLDYILAGQLRNYCPITSQTLLYEGDPHTVSCENTGITSALREMDGFLGNFVPEEETNPHFNPLVKLEEPSPGDFCYGNPKRGDDRVYVKEVAYYLRKVVEYALKERRNIEVS